MTTEELKQVLEAQKTQGVEADIVEALSCALCLNTAVVARVMYASSLYFDTNPIPLWDVYLDTEVQKALALMVAASKCRLIIRRAIENSGTVTVAAKYLLRGKATGICDGCSQSIRCIAENAHTPDECLEKPVVVYPLRFLNPKTIEVECAHPAGKFIVPLRLFYSTLAPEVSNA